MSEIKPNRKTKRLIAFEVKRNDARIKKIEVEFVDVVMAIDPYAEDDTPNLEDSVYKGIYNTYLSKFNLLINKMEQQGSYKYTDPNRNYFKELFNPINGTRIK